MRNLPQNGIAAICFNISAEVTRPVVSLPGSEQDLTAPFLPASCISGMHMTWAGSLEQPSNEGLKAKDRVIQYCLSKAVGWESLSKGRKAGDLGIASERWTGLNPNSL